MNVPKGFDLNYLYQLNTNIDVYKQEYYHQTFSNNKVIDIFKPLKDGAAQSEKFWFHGSIFIPFELLSSVLGNNFIDFF